MSGLAARTPGEEVGDRELIDAIRAGLAEVRERTLILIEPLTREQITGQPAPVMGTVAWDVGHIGAFEELWLVDALDGPSVGYDDLSETFDPIHLPRSQRGEMELPEKGDLKAYLSRVRKTTLDVLDRIELDDRDLTRAGFVYDMLIRHEQQHQENVLITLQLMETEPQGPEPEQPDLVPIEPYTPPIRQAKPEATVDVDGWARLPGGTFPMGTDQRVGHYDNETPQHAVQVDPFEIKRALVTNREYLAFIQDGGYVDQRWWSTDGWMISQALGLEHPRYWRKQGDAWRVREYDRWVDLPLDQPVMNVSYYEAEAYAAWAGARLPSEAEWEMAATWDPQSTTKHRFPWGDDPWTPELANLGQRLFGPAPVGAYPDGASPSGCHQMAGDVWEWTTTIFSGYPGFQAFPYEEYSEIHFDAGYQVLRGGSWATWPDCATGTFRNWHQPDHQQAMTGIRLARDVGP